MVRPNRVKEFNFSVGSVTADAGGELDAYSEYPLNGHLKGVVVYGNNFAATGSFFLNVSGVEATAWSMVSGTARGVGVDASGLYLVQGAVQSTESVRLSGTNFSSIYTEIPLNSVMHLVGSNVGASKSGLGIGVVYV